MLDFWNGECVRVRRGEGVRVTSICIGRSDIEGDEYKLALLVVYYYYHALCYFVNFPGCRRYIKPLSLDNVLTYIYLIAIRSP